MIQSRLSQSIVITLSFIWLTHSLYMPLSVSFLSALALSYFAYFAFMQKRHWPHQRWLQYLYVILSVGLVYLQFKSLIGVEAGCALLWIFLVAKAFEVKQPRDLVVLLNFALFVIASVLLYGQGMLNALMATLATLLVFTGFYRIQMLHYAADQPPAWRQELKLVFTLVACAVPLFLILFLFMPRLPPLWYVPIKQNEGVTGLSDEMRVGDIASLSQSRELAFRILIEPQHLLPRSQLYWRAMVLDHYDGQRWRTGTWSQLPVTEQALALREQRAVRRFDYQFLPSQAHVMWISALEYSHVRQPNFQQRQDGGIVPVRPLRRVQPIALTWLGTSNQIPPQAISQHPQYFETLLKTNLAFLPEQNPRTQALAQKLWQQSGGNAGHYVQLVLQWLQANDFRYSLKPGQLQGDVTDQFLFETRQGFCEHYASSFTLLMRYAGVPSRVVVGYQGGEWAPDGASWEVRQLDAHAWSEVWLAGQGWVRIDPTAVVSPDRIQVGMQDYVQQADATHGLDRFQVQQYQWLTRMQVWSDYLNYQWQSKVVGYDTDRQKNWLGQFGLKHAGHYVLFAIGAIGFGLLLAWALRYVYVHHWRVDLSDSVRHISQKLSSAGLEKQPAESLHAWLIRLKPHARDAVPFDALLKLLETRRYQQHMQPQDEKLMVDLLKQCAKELKLK